MARADSGLDITSAAGAAVQQIHDVLVRNRLSVSLAADTCELPGDREVDGEVGLEMELEGDSAKVSGGLNESLFSTGSLTLPSWQTSLWLTCEAKAMISCLTWLYLGGHREIAQSISSGFSIP